MTTGCGAAAQDGTDTVVVQDDVETADRRAQ